MPEHIRALIVILAIAAPTFWLLRKPMTAGAISPSDYKIRCWLWLIITIVLFTAQSFWFFFIISALLLVTVGGNDSNSLGLYFFLLLLAPPFQATVPGLAGINNLLAFDYLRLLSLTLLLPTAIRLHIASEAPALLKIPTDKYILGYLFLLLFLQAPVTSTTNLMREGFLLYVDVFLPYFVCSRLLSDPNKMRDAFASFAAAGVALAILGIFETLKGWLLYAALPGALGVSWSWGSYMLRDSGLRATVSAGHSIVFGYLMTVALGFLIAVRSAIPSRQAWRVIALMLGAGVLASWSRGPWVGAAVLVVIAIVAGPGFTRRIGAILCVSVVVGPMLMFTPFASKIIALLPFIGTAETDSVDYRQRLFDISWQVIQLNPLFGTPFYMKNSMMQQLIQGEGIIDMVNSYLGIALGSGFAGLVLFTAPFITIAARLAAFTSRSTDKLSFDYELGRGLLATLIAVMLMIATVSSQLAVPVVYWCLAGAGAAFLARVGSEREVRAYAEVGQPSFRKP